MLNRSAVITRSVRPYTPTIVSIVHRRLSGISNPFLLSSQLTIVSYDHPGGKGLIVLKCGIELHVHDS